MLCGSNQNNIFCKCICFSEPV
ncbi:hypothetical protein KUCAC02_034297 [Chaenocephalus aceratus]|nr:hypothetical protein KUCAC02_034297 [Chaenocephalus aceratus]